MSDTAYPVFQHYGTNAQRTAFTPAPAAGTQPIYIWYETDTGSTYLYDTTWHALSTASPGTVTTTGSPASGQMAQFSGATSITGVAAPGNICEGRLTTESGVPVSTSDRTAQGTIYFTPSSPTGIAIGTGQIALYNGTMLVLKTFTQLSLALTVTSDKNYDVFVDYNSGTPQLVLSAAWTNDTTRADALATQAGIVVKSGTAAYRWVGTMRASGSNVTEDSLAKRFVWNAYNQVRRSMANAKETTDSWNYTTAAFRQANANAANQLAYVTGDAASRVDATVFALAASNTNVNCAVGVGVDSTTVNSARYFGSNSQASGFALSLVAFYDGTPGLGYHTLAWLEYGGTTMTQYGDAGAPTVFQSGMSGTIGN